MFLGTKIAKGDEHEDDYYMYNQKKGGIPSGYAPLSEG